MTSQPLQSLGSYAKGEVPEPLAVTIKDGDGVVIDLTLFTAKIAFTAIEGGNSALGSGTVTVPLPKSDGIVQYDFHVNDMAEVGLYRIQFWLSDGTNVLASEVFQYTVEEVTVLPTFP